MVITRQDRNIIIEASDSINMGAVQKIIDYINILEIAAASRGTEEQASDLAEQINKNWWAENKSRFLP